MVKADIPTFESLPPRHLKLVFSVFLDRDRDAAGIKELEGSRIKIDGEIYICLRVSGYTDPPLRKGERVALTVKSAKAGA